MWDGERLSVSPQTVTVYRIHLLWVDSVQLCHQAAINASDKQSIVVGIQINFFSPTHLKQQ